ncbi:MAG: thiamine phosphate synthase, partial [Spirochaetes bacterium]|nr:thiamine phosphate synthase [Spirochaetota bacterium]
LEYLEYAVQNVPIPFVAIGGIKEHNLKQVVAKGAKTICLVTEITNARHIPEKINCLNHIIKETK